MLTEEEKKFLKKIPYSKKVRIKPFNPKIRKIAEKPIKIIQKITPELEIKFMGASALGVAGQGDIDLYILCPSRDFQKYLPVLIDKFGEPKHITKTFIQWSFTKDAHDVELYLSDPTPESMRRQLKTFRILKNSPRLREEYQEIKESFDGKSYRAYQRKKYEFYNRILAEHN